MHDPHSEQVSYLKFVMFSAVLGGLILFSMIFGGYSSFIRAENRIAETKDALLGSCKEQVALLSDVARLTDSQNHPESLPAPPTTLAQASAVIQQAMFGNRILDEGATKALEASQDALTRDVGQHLQRLRAEAKGEKRAEVESLWEKFVSAQDQVFLAGKNYREEIAYFNMRLQSFPVSFVARLFGFDKSIYYPPSDQAFLPARKTLQP